MPFSHAIDYPLWLNALLFAAAGAAIWIAGTRLVRYLDRLAIKTGLGQAFAGMLLLGGITSLPEVANVTASSANDNPALAVNNLLGSASINVLLLAVADAAIGRDALTSVVTQPATLMQATLCMLVLVLVAASVTTGDFALVGIGAWSILICAAAVGALWLSAHYSERTPWKPTEMEEVSGDEAGDHAERAQEQSLGPLILKAAVGAAAIFFAGYTLSQTGDAIAEQTGLGAGMVGFALIGISTSLPELSTITTALRIKRYEMAISEVMGTNFINLSLILLADLVFRGAPVVDQLGPFEVVSALLGVLLTGLILVGLLQRRNPTILRMGYDSLAVMIVFVLGLGLLATIR
jgi:cation:H+ antiporter